MFFNYNFFLGGWGVILSLRHVCFTEISIKFSILIPYMTYFKKKTNSPTVSEGLFLIFFDTKTKKGKNAKKYRKMLFIKKIFDIFC